MRINPNDGSFVIAWSSMQNGNWDVFAKKFDLTQPAATPDVAINTNTTLKPNTQYFPLPVFCEISGELLIGFTGIGSNGTNEVYYQRCTYAGTALSVVPGSVEQQLNTAITNQQNLVAMEYSTFSNQVIATYHSNVNTATGYDVYRRVISYSEATGTYSTDTETIVNTSNGGNEQNGHVAINQTTGNYSITWTSSTGWKVFSKIYNASHVMIKDEFSVLGTQTNYSELGGRSVWDESSNVLIIFWHYYNPGGTTLWYSMVDGSNLTYITGSETQITAAGNTKLNYSQAYYLGYNNLSHRITLAYDVFNGLGSIGYCANFTYAHPSFNPAVSINDGDMNWTDDKVFNGYGDVIAESRVYYDQFGKVLQNQVLNPEDKTITEQMPLYDYLDRPAIQTLGAPLEKTIFSYDRAFVANGAEMVNPYSTPPVVVGLPYLTGQFDDSAKINNPDPVFIGIGLGNYYSKNRQTNNVYEPTVPQTSFPYSRQIFNDNAPGGVIKQTLPGDAHRAGLGHEMKTITLPVLNELDYYMSIRNANFVTTGTQTTLNCKATKTIETDPNGIISSITFTNQDGLTVATARDRDETTTGKPMQVALAPNTYSLYVYHVIGSKYFQIIGNEDVIIFDDATASQIYPVGSTGIPGPISGFNLTNYPSVNNIQIRSRENFHIKYLDYNNIWHYNDVAQYQDGQSGIDLYLQTGHALSLSCATPNIQIQVVDLTSGNPVYTGTVSGFNSSSLNGYYRFLYNSTNMPYSPYYSDAAHFINFNFQAFYNEYAYFFYDDMGRLIARTAPKGINYTDTYTYNGAGQVVSMTEVDGGTTNYVYLPDGRLRFSQNADQAVTGKFSFVNYDNENRVVKSGEYAGTNYVFQTKYQNRFNSYEPKNFFTILTATSLPGDATNAGLGADTDLSDFNKITYSSVVPYNLTNATNTSIGTRTPRNVWNDISQTTNKAGYTTQYSYDNDYRLEWTAQTLPGLGSKTVDYVYDQSNQLLQTIYQKDQLADRFEHINKYDKIGRLRTVWTRESTGMTKLQERDYYYQFGPLKRKEIGTIQGLDYVYTIQGWLKGINPYLGLGFDDGSVYSNYNGFAPDVFGMVVDYYDGDYKDKNILDINAPQQVTQYGLDKPSLSGNLYNGTIRSLLWETTDNLNPNNTPFQFCFNYDNKYQLVAGISGYPDANTWNFVANENQMSMMYDANGNLTYKYTAKSTGGESYTYRYDSGGNKLTRLMLTSGLRYYDYNNIGQMTRQAEPGGTTGKKVYYTPAGLVSYVTDLSATPKMIVKYEYNESGQRAKKISYDQTGAVSFTTWYVNDAAGNNLSIYDNNGTTVQQKEIPIYGSSRLGNCYKAGTSLTYTYELKDHLGNVRATIRRTKTAGGLADVLSWADYLPFGEVMPGHNRAGSLYQNRHGYQGEYAECDPETATGAIGGWNSFDLRMYDANVGRWLSRDPMGQYWSPYTGMGNNPVNGVDPTGGERNPIYSMDGEFLGTDNKGLQGEAIFMNKEDFTQGMSHDVAMSKGLSIGEMMAEGFSGANLDNMLLHYNGLSSRPDWDGYLTKEEADAWWLEKSGDPLFVDQSKIELPGITTKSFNNINKSSFYKNFVWGLSNTGKVYGTVKLTLQNASTGTVHIGGQKYLDQYDYDMDGRYGRDFLTWAGRPGNADAGKKFYIYGYGQAGVPIVK